MNFDTSKKLFERAQEFIPGGVNSPVRAFKSVGGTPIFFKSAKGAYLHDVDGNQYIDYVGSWGPMILGNAYEPVIEAVREAALNGTSFGAPTEIEVKMAELITQNVPNVDSIRMVNSGTEACMSAIRAARGFTGRDKIIKFEGCYHGHGDSFLIKAGSGVSTLGLPNSPGVTKGTAQDTLTAPYNNLEAVEELVTANKNDVAAIIIEPVPGNMGCIIPEKGFLEGLRKLCTDHGIVLIFDEVMTGFRLSFGGAQALLGIDADLMTYGKIIGAGMPVGAYGGKQEIMDVIAPVGPVYQAGTLSGNPLAMVAGYTLLKELVEHPEYYNELSEKTAYLKKGWTEILNDKGIAHSINQLGSMISLHFGDGHVRDFESSKQSADNGIFKTFFHAMLNGGVYLPPSAYESCFLSNALSQEDLDKTLEVTKEAVSQL